MASGTPSAEADEFPLKEILKIFSVKKITIHNGQKSEDLPQKEDQTKETGKKSIPENIANVREVEEAAEFAAQATGVRKDFLMGMLAVESDLGRKTGECTYGEVKKEAEESYENGKLSQRAWNTFQERKKIISDLAGELGYDHEKLRVSCNPPYAGTGGALGVSQFMPDIWMLYKNEIASVVGKENPDPWDARDGVVAMALLLADTPGVVNHNYYSERNAAKMYLSGTTSPAYNWYANQAFYWSINYRRLL